MVLWKVYRSSDNPGDEYNYNMVEWLHRLPPLSWDGDDEGIVIYPEPYVLNDQEPVEVAFVGDYITAIDGKPRAVKGDSVQLDGEFAIFTLDGVRYRVGLGK